MSIEFQGRLLLVGAGKMGGALLAGWLANGLSPSQVIVQDPSPAGETAAVIDRAGIEVRKEAQLLDPPPALIVIAVKPQIMDEVLPSLAGSVGPNTLLVSVAAGRTLAGIEKHFPGGTAVIRTIPNTPAAVGRGITVCVANRHVTPAERRLCDQILGSVGTVGWVNDEDLIDVATAVSGSGPAYVFLLAETLAAAGVKAGLPADLARRLADATVAGAGELLHQSGEDPAKLRQNVTSPNGTTFAALSVLMGDGGMAPLLEKAVAAAARRSRELSA